VRSYGRKIITTATQLVKPPEIEPRRTSSPSRVQNSCGTTTIPVGRRRIARARRFVGEWRVVRHIGRGGRQEQGVERFVDRRHECEPHVRTHGGRDLADVFFIRRGHQHLAQSTPVRRQHFFFHASDFEHLAAQRHFAGHRHIAPHRATAHHTGNRQCHRHAGTRAVLRHRSRREVNVQIGRLHFRVNDPQRPRP
jgi:hypothetical protein